MKSMSNRIIPSPKNIYFNCEYCSKVINQKNKFLPFCSKHCVIMAENDTNHVEIKCLHCSAMFIPEISTIKYCSKKCRLDATRVQTSVNKQKDPRFLIFKRDNFRCYYCGASSDSGAVLEIDHIVPISKRGKNDIFNLITSCQKCNSQKGSSALDPEMVMEIWERNKRLNVQLWKEYTYEELVLIFDSYLGIKTRVRSIRCLRRKS